ncbi:hypothetical protein V8F33_003479 [Rhypophila sp. PSN 637]
MYMFCQSAAKFVGGLVAPPGSATKAWPCGSGLSVGSPSVRLRGFLTQQTNQDSIPRGSPLVGPALDCTGSFVAAGQRCPCSPDSAQTVRSRSLAGVTLYIRAQACRVGLFSSGHPPEPDVQSSHYTSRTKMADRKERRLILMLSHAGRKDLIPLNRDEALYQHLTTLLNRRTPLKLNDCRGRWVKALSARYSNTIPPTLDIICFTFALRHFNFELIDVLNDEISNDVLSIIKKTVSSVLQADLALIAQDSSSPLKVFPWGDVAQFVSQSNWDLAWRYLEEVRRDWNACVQVYTNYGLEENEKGDQDAGNLSKSATSAGSSANPVSLPSFDELVAKLGANLDQGGVDEFMGHRG